MLQVVPLNTAGATLSVFIMEGLTNAYMLDSQRFNLITNYSEYSPHQVIQSDCPASSEIMLMDRSQWSYWIWGPRFQLASHFRRAYQLKI
jgi:hypothetical protein